MNRFTAIAPVVLSFVAAPARSQDMPESSPQALKHYAEGIEAYVQARYQDAIPHFRMAYASDPTFYAALLMAGVCAGNAGERAQADSFYALVVPHKDRLSAYYQSRLEAQMASSAGDLAAYIAGNRRAAAAGPGTKAAYNVAQGVIQQGRANEARAMLRQLDPDREPMRGYPPYFGVYTYAAHQLGDYEDELQMARRAQGPLSGDVRAVALEVEALVPLGRTAEAEQLLTQIQTMPSAPGGVTPGEVTTNAALELAAHGSSAAAERWLASAIKWFDALPAAEARTADNRADKAYALYAAARYQEAAAIYDGLASELPGQPQWQAWQGLLGALLGDKAKAMDVSHRIETNTVRVGANSAVWRAWIAAGMNDGAGAIALFQQSGVRGRWMHRDPVLRRVLGQTPAWIAYLKSVD